MTCGLTMQLTLNGYEMPKVTTGLYTDDIMYVLDYYSVDHVEITYVSDISMSNIEVSLSEIDKSRGYDGGDLWRNMCIGSSWPISEEYRYILSDYNANFDYA